MDVSDNGLQKDTVVLRGEHVETVRGVGYRFKDKGERGLHSGTDY